ncbi:MAG: right-handed parallel beta-helix repeat-containing protein, partial [Planctomycetota bacterium]
GTGPTLEQLNAGATKNAIDIESLPPSFAGGAQHEIIRPGVYELRRNLLPNGFNTAISICSSGVTINLNGYSITAFTDRAFSMQITFRGVVIRNGTIIDCNSVVDGGNIRQQDWAIEDLRIDGRSSNGKAISLPGGIAVRRCMVCGHSTGIELGSGSIVESCTAVETRGTGGVAIAAGRGSIVQRSVVREPEGKGFVLGQATTATDCVASGARFNGFELDDAAVVTNCVAENNTGDGFNGIINNVLRSCIARSNRSHGIEMGESSLIESCALNANRFGGIVVGNRNLVRNNMLDFHQDESSASAINVNGSDNRVEDNSIVRASDGIRNNGDRNLYMRNRLSLITFAPYQLAGGSSTFSQTGSGASTSLPHVNFVMA